LLQASDFELVFNAINRFYTLAPNPEITMEANPDDMTQAYISALKQLPFNRFSMGVQSFHADDLRLLNRRHTAQQALDAISCCQHAGYSNLSIDLIFELPGQTLQKWEENLTRALSLHIPHLSAYCLSYEEGTDLHRMVQAGTIEPVSEETGIDLFDMLIDRLEAAGYLHYEISNFCKPGYHSQHNTAYWTDRKYMGIGPAAHSYNYQSRQWNIASLPEYIEGITSGIPKIEKEIIDERMRYNEYLLTRLRTMWGIQIPAFREIFGGEQLATLLQQAKKFLQSGLMEKDDEIIKITQKGLFVTDSIIRELIEI
jgi:oxygen-independent coproporphyrinogen-3 oxidase